MKLNGQTRVIVATAAVLALTDIGVRLATVNYGAASMSGGVVTAREFRLVDRNGVPRATLSVDNADEPGLVMYDRTGTPRLQIDTWENNPSLTLRDKDGQRKTFFGTNENTGQGIITEYAPDGSAQTSIELSNGSGFRTMTTTTASEPSDAPLKVTRSSETVQFYTH